MTSNKTIQLSPGLKFVKTFCGMMIPISGFTAVVSGILSLFKNAEGSHSHEISLCVLCTSLIVMFVLKWLDKKLKKKNYSYVVYRSSIVYWLDPGTMLPLITLTLIILLPFYLLFVTSIKTPVEANSLKFTWYPTMGISWEAYKELFSYESIIGISMGRALWNSFVYAFIPTIVGLFASATAAYAFAKMEFRNKKRMFELLIATMMMPGCVTMATGYIMYDWYGWTNSELPLIIPGLFGAAGTVMFLREFFMGIPGGLVEAAKIDGAGTWQCYMKIVLPLAKPALIAQFVLGFIGKFNDFMTPLIYLNNPLKYTIQVALNFVNSAISDYASIAASGAFALIPMLLLYVIFQKKILYGVSISSGLKG